MAARMGMGRTRPKSAGARPPSAGGARPSSSSSGNRPSTANGRLSSYEARPSTANGRPSTANGRPSSAPRQPVSVDEKGRPRYATQRERVAERLEMRRQHKAEKARLKAEKPKLDHLDWKMRGRALWMMFSMSYYVKIVLGLGILMVFIAIVLIAVGASTEDDLKDADTITALLFVFGIIFIIISILAIRSRRREKAKRRRLGYDKKTGRYGPDILKTSSNGSIPTISEDVDEAQGHINGIPLEDKIPFSKPKPKKPTFSAVKADEETGFTNLSVVIDADVLPGTPYRQRRRESIENSLTTFNRNQILASSSLKDDPDILVVPPPRDKLSVSSKSGDGKKVKKSKSPKTTPNKAALQNIPEVITTGPSPRPSPLSGRKAPPITIIDTDELEEEELSSVSKPSKKKHDYKNEGFEDGDVTPNDLV